MPEYIITKISSAMCFTYNMDQGEMSSSCEIQEWSLMPPVPLAAEGMLGFLKVVVEVLVCTGVWHLWMEVSSLRTEVEEVQFGAGVWQLWKDVGEVETCAVVGDVLLARLLEMNHSQEICKHFFLHLSSFVIIQFKKHL